MKNYVGHRFQKFDTTGAMGVRTDERYIRCFWPGVKVPTAIFVEGSSGLEVMGPPTPRNIIFPPDTVFLDRMPNAEPAAKQAVANMRRDGLARLINLTDEQSDIYWEKLSEVGGKPRPSVGRDRFFLEELGEPAEKGSPVDRFVALLTEKEVDDYGAGRVTDTGLRKRKTFKNSKGAAFDRAGQKRVR